MKEEIRQEDKEESCESANAGRPADVPLSVSLRNTLHGVKLGKVFNK